MRNPAGRDEGGLCLYVVQNFEIRILSLSACMCLHLDNKSFAPLEILVRTSISATACMHRLVKVGSAGKMNALAEAPRGRVMEIKGSPQRGSGTSLAAVVPST